MPTSSASCRVTFLFFHVATDYIRYICAYHYIPVNTFLTGKPDGCQQYNIIYKYRMLIRLLIYRSVIIKVTTNRYSIIYVRMPDYVCIKSVVQVLYHKNIQRTLHKTHRVTTFLMDLYYGIIIKKKKKKSFYLTN